MKALKDKSLDEIRHEWDSISDLRYRQITSGVDLSYKYVILPSVKKLCKNSDCSSILDVGCGTGILAAEVSSLSSKIVGIDLSSKSIEIARSHCEHLDNVIFENTTVENYAATMTSSAFTLAVANMTLMTCVDLLGTLRAIEKLLIAGGTFVATLAHPCFWPKYWGYDQAEWFDYSKQIIIEAPFKISIQPTDCITTHVHRPLGMYLNALANCGFAIDKFIEPMPDTEVEGKYPQKWESPRFVGIRCWKKRGSNG